MIWLTYLSIFTICIYMVYIFTRKQSLRVFPPSLSATYYRLGKKGYIFQLAIMISGFSIMPPMLEITPDNFQFLAFLACAGVLMVGGSPAFAEKLEGKVHSAGAVTLLVCSQIWCGVMLWWSLLTWVILGIFLIPMFRTLYKLRKSGVILDVRSFLASYKVLFWVEVIAIVTTFFVVCFYL